MGRNICAEKIGMRMGTGMTLNTLNLGRYRIEEQIGAGGMGVVYRARDQRLDRDVALKVLPPGSLADEGSRNRFRKEALALSRMSHPNIAVVHDFDTQDDTDFLVMELIPGMTLEEKLITSPVAETEALKWVIQLLEGLAAAHEQGVIHCDIKPSNLRVTPDGRIKILDFGLAKFLKHADAVSITMSITQDHGEANSAQADYGSMAGIHHSQIVGEGSGLSLPVGR